MLGRISLAVPVILVFCLSGCNRAANEAIARQAARPGVWALTANGLVEIPEYGAYNLEPFTQEVSFKFDHSVPQVVAPQAFVANLPGAAMKDAQLYLLPAPTRENGTGISRSRTIPSP